MGDGRRAQPNDRMGVVVICAEYPPFVQGGLGVHYHELLEHLRRHCDVTLIAAQPWKQRIDDTSSPGLEIRRVRVPGVFPLNHLAFNVGAWRQSRKVDADLVHLCAPFGLGNLLFDRRPVVSKLHSLYGGQLGSALYQRVIFPLASQLDRLFMRRSRLVMTTSRFMERAIRQLAPRSAGPILVVNNGIADRWFERTESRQAAREALDIPVDVPLLLTVGRLVPRKGALGAVEALGELRRQHPDAQLLIIGAGFTEGRGYATKVQRAIRDNGLEGAVRIVGWRSAEEMRVAYAAADIYIHPASFEPFGNVVLEAAACGLPVVTYRGGGPEEVMGPAALYPSSTSPDELAHTISRLLSDRELMVQVGSACRDRAGLYRWSRAAEDTHQAYRLLLDRA